MFQMTNRLDLVVEVLKSPVDTYVRPIQSFLSYDYEFVGSYYQLTFTVEPTQLSVTLSTIL